MEWSYPWLSIDKDRLYDDGDFAQFYANLFTDGVSMTTADALKVTINPTGGMRIQVGAGAAFFQGRSYFNSIATALPIEVASSSQDRTDGIVIQMNKGMRTIKLIVKKGDTSVVRQTDIYELQLATVKIPKNASEITASNITDKRSDELVCGYCTPYQNVNVSGLENQYKDLLQNTLDLLNEYAATGKVNFQKGLDEFVQKGDTQLDNQTKQWQEFLQQIGDELSENQALNLQNQLNKLTANKDLFQIKHGLDHYPQVVVTAWSNGFGITALGEKGWLGDVPETVPTTIGYPSKNELTVKIIADWQLLNPTVLPDIDNSYLLVEGTKAVRIRLY
ncbi:structural protein [Enterococcus pseudoavium]|uniref:Structural protein n=1 Tax=Enterococcus pseudoavium TaxID=44007 RepID=A0AAE4L2A2_9ENTE|nr:structural protein [Enterococcus pseudoavium]MDT2737671.1 structural protein [Enterococcus pseudoavium]